MPAQTKYLSSRGQRALKITAAVLGAYLVSASFHLMLGAMPFAREIIVVLSGVSFFIIWAGLMVAGFLVRNGWKLWGIYLLLTLIFGAGTWILK